MILYNRIEEIQFLFKSQQLMIRVLDGLMYRIEFSDLYKVHPTHSKHPAITAVLLPTAQGLSIKFADNAEICYLWQTLQQIAYLCSDDK